MSRLRFSTAREVFETYPAAHQAVTMPPTTEPPLSFLARLLKGPAPMEAAGFCAFLLPRRPSARPRATNTGLATMKMVGTSAR